MLVSAQAILVSLLVAIAFLVAIRTVDLNEREPLWALGILFVLGAVAALLVDLLVGSTVLELTILPSAIAREVSKFVATAAGLGILAVVSRSRGWSEINGPMDGIVYGATAGLGFAAGTTFLREITTTTEVIGVLPLWSALVGNFLSGLAEGVFAAIGGLGLAVAAHARTTGTKVGAALGSLALAVLLHAGFDWFARGGALGGAASARAWIALLLPLVLVGAVVAMSISRERRAIASQLAAEIATGAVSDEDRRVLSSWSDRQAMYLKLLLRFRVREWSVLTTLHNWQVQLALTRARESRETDERRRGQLREELEHLRAAVVSLKAELRAD